MNALKGGLGLIPDDPSRIAPYDLRQSYMSLSWPWVRLLRVLAVFPASPEGSTPPPIKALSALPAPGVGAGWGYAICAISASIALSTSSRWPLFSSSIRLKNAL